MKALIRAYKAGKDNESRTGASPAVLPFHQQMDDIFGERPISIRGHIIESAVAEPLDPPAAPIAASPPSSLESTPTPPPQLPRTSALSEVTTETDCNNHQPIAKKRKVSKKFELVELKMKYRQQKLEIFEKKRNSSCF